MQKTAFFLSSSLMVLLVSLLSIAINIEIDNSRWLDADDPVEELKNYVKKEFDQDEELIIAIELDEHSTFFSQEVLDFLTNFEKDLKQKVQIKEIRHPFNISFLLKGDNDTIEVTNFKESSLSLEEMKEVFQDSYYYGRYISENFQSFLIVIAPKMIGTSAQKDVLRQELQTHMDRILDKYSLFSRFKFAGETKLNHELNSQNAMELKRLIPFIFLLILVLLGLYYRNLKAMFIVSFSAVVTFLGALSIFTLTQTPLSIIGTIIPLLISSIAISDSLHILNYYVHRKLEGGSVMKKVISFTWRPCLITSLTTSIGLASFFQSEMPIVRELALVGPLAILFSYLLIISSNWTLLYLLRPNIELKNFNFAPFARLTSFKASLLKKAFCFLFPVISVPLILQYHQTETNLLDAFFKKESKMQKDFSYIDNYHGGTGLFELIFGREESIDFHSIKTYNSIVDIGNDLAGINGIKRVESYVMPVRLVHKKMSDSLSEDPTSSDALAQELLFLEFSRSDRKDDILKPFLNFNGKVGRMALRTENVSNEESKKIKESIREHLKKISYKAGFSGNNEYFLRLSTFILKIQGRSLSITLLSIFILMMIFYHFKASLAAVIVNIIPLTGTMLIIVFLKIPFDFSTILISSICFGIAVDDSIHLIHHIDRGAGTLQERFFKGLEPIVLITAIFTGVFLICGTSPLVLLSRFGIFSAAVMVLSLLTTLVFLPNFYGREKSKLP